MQPQGDFPFLNSGRVVIIYDNVFVLVFVWCSPCMAFNNNVSVQHDGAWVSPRYYTVDPMLLPSENPFKCHEEVLYLQPMILSKRFDIFQLVNQWLNFTYSRSHAFRYERKNTNPTLVRIELTTSVLADVQLTY